MAIELISKIKPKNGGNFAMVDAEDVEMPDGTRLDQVAKNIPTASELIDGQIIQVVEGVPQWVPMENSSVKTYIDNYISEALGGDY